MVFILDEFDLFAKPFKQTVLYNLLDALQTSSVQVSAPLQINKPQQMAPCLEKPSKYQPGYH